MLRPSPELPMAGVVCVGGSDGGAAAVGGGDITGAG